MSEDELSAWAERVGAFRREGKSRRTNALGQSRCRSAPALAVIPAANADASFTLPRPLAAARRVMDLAKSLALPPVETTPWPIAPPTPAADFKALPPTPARL